VAARRVGTGRRGRDGANVCRVASVPEDRQRAVYVPYLGNDSLAGLVQLGKLAGQVFPFADQCGYDVRLCHAANFMGARSGALPDCWCACYIRPDFSATLPPM